MQKKLPPVITKEITDSIENIIKQRVLDELFDDPVRIERKDNDGKDDLQLDFEKSKKGLGQIYEDEFR